MSNKPIWSGDMRKSNGRFFLALSPVPEKFWTDHVLCEMAYQEDGELKSVEIQLSADDWFAMEPVGNMLGDSVMVSRSAPPQSQEEP